MVSNLSDRLRPRTLAAVSGGARPASRPAGRVRPRAAVLLPLTLGLATGGLAACGGGGDGPPPQPSSVALADPGTALAGTVGADLAAPVRVRVTATDGRAVRGTPVTWTAADGGRATPASSVTDADGIAATVWTLGSTAGQQTLTAAAGAVVVRTQLTAAAAGGRPATVRVQGDSSLGLVPGLALSLSAVVADRFGNQLAAPVTWRSADPTVATVDESGRLIARAPGTTAIEATSDTARARLTVRVDAVSLMAITRVAPDTLRPGGTVTIEGAGFVQSGGGTEVFVSGVRVTPQEVTATRIVATVPAVAALPCRAAADGAVSVRRNLGTGVVDSVRQAVVLPVATRRTLRVGESVAMLTADEARCTQLDGGGRYVVSVFNTDQSADRLVFAQLRGTAGAAPAAQPLAARTPSRVVAPRAAAAPTAAEQRAMDGARTHAERLEWERTVVRRAGSPVAALRAARTRGEAAGPRLLGRARRPAPTSRSLSPSGAPSAAVAAAVAPALGDTVSINVYNLSSRTCSRAIPVRARVVYVGTRSVVYEDVGNSQAGTMDAEYRQVGQEFDDVMFPILQRNFGEPLAMDQQLDRDGKIGMIFSKVLNDSMPNVLGFVTSCNFYPRSDASFAASNEMELFYARAPRQGEGAAAWRYSLRSTTIHEVKHITAFGEKIARAGTAGIPNYEDSWLEESTARISEELFARTFSNAEWRGNTGYAGTVGCELTRCDDRPFSMAKHWTTLHLFYRNVGELSPFAGSNDFNATYYASGWSLVRWAVDQYAGTSESAFLRDLTLEPRLTGMANIAARTGRPPNEMLADWGLAMYVDDTPGLAPLRPQLSLPSWNGRDILRGLNGFSASSYPGAFPLAVRPVTFGEFQSPDLLLRGWSTAFFELSGAPLAPQLLELRAPGGGAVAPTIRLAMVRVE